MPQRVDPGRPMSTEEFTDALLDANHCDVDRVIDAAGEMYAELLDRLYEVQCDLERPRTMEELVQLLRERAEQFTANASARLASAEALLATTRDELAKEKEKNSRLLTQVEAYRLRETSIASAARICAQEAQKTPHTATRPAPLPVDPVRERAESEALAAVDNAIDLLRKALSSPRKEEVPSLVVMATHAYKTCFLPVFNEDHPGSAGFRSLAGPRVSVFLGLLATAGLRISQSSGT